MADDIGIATAWEYEENSARVRFSKIGCTLALILVPAGVTLDVYVYPDFLLQFFLIRLAADIFLLGIMALHFTKWGQRYIRLLTLSWLITPQIAICYMIYLADGFSSTYYAGLNLATLGMGTVLPVTVWEVAVFEILTTCFYLIAGFFHHGGAGDHGLIYNNLYFMALTSIISATAVHFNRRRRYREFRLNFELNIRNQDLAELDRLKSEFFANISHEFRTPLTLILAPLDRLLEEHRDLPGRVVRRLELMRQNSLRLLHLVNDLLDVIRLEEGRADLERRDLRLDTLLGGVVESMGPLAEARGLVLRSRIADEPIWVVGDRGALEKIFYNLLSNAIKFTRQGGQVIVRSRVDNDSVEVMIEDTGIGMSGDSLPHVFDRFRQADSSATRRYGGTGLGLALVKELTERHGGQANIRSILGKGTRVYITLPTTAGPRTDSDGGPEAPETEISPQRQLDLAALKSAVGTLPEPAQEPRESSGPHEGTVLVVDDEPDMRRYLVDLLEDKYRVLVARDGREALAMARRFRPDLIVLDLMLPEIDGLEVCRRIKQDAELRASRIVLLTARAEEPSKLVALQNGADDFLTKPFSGVEVQTRLRNLLHSAELEQDLHRRNRELEDTLGQLRETQDQLVHSEKLNALGRLSAGLLHEINNPLNYALTAIEFAKSDPVLENEADLRETLGDIDGGMQRIRGIVKELRAFAYPSKSEQVAFRLAEPVDAALQMLAHEARGVAVHNRVEGERVVVGSRNHITQVVVNLLSNAFKAIRVNDAQRPGEVTLTSRVEAERVVVCVRDNGTGIPKVAMDRIFDPFYTTADVGEGMGMGLSVCQTIIRNHGGELVVDSSEGQWTEFRFDLAGKMAEAGEARLNASPVGLE